MVLAVEARESSNTHDKLGVPPLREHDGCLSSTWYSLAEAITLWHPLRVSALTRVSTDNKVLFERACILNQFAENTASLC